MNTSIDEKIQQLKAENEAAKLLLKKNINGLGAADIMGLFSSPVSHSSQNQLGHTSAPNGLYEIVKLSSLLLSKKSVNRFTLLVDTYTNLSKFFYGK